MIETRVAVMSIIVENGIVLDHITAGNSITAAKVQKDMILLILFILLLLRSELFLKYFSYCLQLFFKKLR